MSAVAWIVFYPELRTPLSFHIFRHLILILFIFIAIRADPCFFSVFLALLSLLDYTRRTSSRWLPTTYFSVFVGFCLSSHSPSIWTFVRSLFLFVSVLFDRFFVKKVGLSRVITDFAFPVVFGVCNQILTHMDPLGIATNVASFCNDYPDFTFLPLRIGGAPFLDAFIGFLAALTSRWRSTRTLPKSVFTILFKLIPTLTVMISIGRWLGEPARVVRIGGVVADASAPCGEIVEALLDLGHGNDIVGLGGLLRNCSDSELARLKAQRSAFIFASDEERVLVLTQTGGIETMSLDPSAPGTRPVFLKSPIGRVRVLTDRQILHPEHYTSMDADLIISVHGQEEDELAHLPLKNAMIVSQSTGAARLHFSAFSDSFLVNADGHALFTEEFQQTAVYRFTHSVKIAPNAIGWCALRTQIAEFVIFAAGALTVIGALFPKSVLVSISRLLSRVFHLKRA
jgi:hypothetical protein